MTRYASAAPCTMVFGTCLPSTRPVMPNAMVTAPIMWKIVLLFFAIGAFFTDSGLPRYNAIAVKTVPMTMQSMETSITVFGFMWDNIESFCKKIYRPGGRSTYARL